MIPLRSLSLHMYTCALIAFLLVLWIDFLVTAVVEVDATITTKKTSLDKTTTTFSKPPSPLFQGNGYDYITLLLRLNQNDATREDRNSLLYPNNDDDKEEDEKNSSKIPHYELQIEVRSRRDHNTTTKSESMMIDEEYDDKEDSSSIGSWSDCNVGNIIPSSTHDNHFPTTITIPNLSSEMTYRYVESA